MTPADRRALLLTDVDTVLDVGANEGQYARWIRSLGFHGRIISFEPVHASFCQLAEAARTDKCWDCHRLALGATDSEVEMSLAQSSICSSIFHPTAQQLRLVPDAATRRTELVPVRTLRSLWSTLGCHDACVYLKVDVEGAELEVLRGAEQILKLLRLVELELSLTPLYQGAPLIGDVWGFLANHGFSVLGFEQNHGDDPNTGQMLMVDGIFRNH